MSLVFLTANQAWCCVWHSVPVGIGFDNRVLWQSRVELVSELRRLGLQVKGSKVSATFGESK